MFVHKDGFVEKPSFRGAILDRTFDGEIKLDQFLGLADFRIVDAAILVSLAATLMWLCLYHNCSSNV